MKNLILLLLLSLMTLPLAHAQKVNQSYVIVGGIFLNIFKLPQELVWAIRDPIRQSEYKKKVEHTKLLANADVGRSNLKCEERCFDDFRILAKGRARMIPNSGEDMLAFLNEKRDFADSIQRTVGYCWGHSSVSRNFNYLASFDPTLLKLEDDEYKPLIKKIMNNNGVVIPGYKNLREFSAVPGIKKILKNQVVWEWLSKSMRIRSAGTSIKGYRGLMEKQKLLEFVAEVKEKLSVNHTPKVFFSNLHKPGFIHVVNIYDVIEEGQSVKLCILDNHQYEDEQKNCGVFVSVKRDGSENFYSGWEDPKRDLQGFVGQFGFTPEDNLEMLTFQKESKRMCIEKCREKMW